MKLPLASLLALVFASSAVACASKCPEAEAPEPPSTAASSAASPSPVAASATPSPGFEPVASAVTSTSAPSAASAEPPIEPAPPASAATPAAPALPEVSIRSFGMHIGGGPNDEASKAPFKRAIEAHFEAFRACYALAEAPEKGGTFGVDLAIGKDGGRAQLKQPRSGVKGTKFRACIEQEFGEIDFPKPPKGRTMVSYSLRFDVRER